MLFLRSILEFKLFLHVNVVSDGSIDPTILDFGHRPHLVNVLSQLVANILHELLQLDLKS